MKLSLKAKFDIENKLGIKGLLSKTQKHKVIKDSFSRCERHFAMKPISKDDYRKEIINGKTFHIKKGTVWRIK